MFNLGIFFIKKGNSIFVSFNILQVQLGLSGFFYLPIKEIMQSIFLYCRGENVNDLRFLPYSPSKSQVNNYFAKASSLKGQIHFYFCLLVFVIKFTFSFFLIIFKSFFSNIYTNFFIRYRQIYDNIYLSISQLIIGFKYFLFINCRTQFFVN